jgi:hypothetical protein
VYAALNSVTTTTTVSSRERRISSASSVHRDVNPASGAPFARPLLDTFGGVIENS